MTPRLDFYARHYQALADPMLALMRHGIRVARQLDSREERRRLVPGLVGGLSQHVQGLRLLNPAHELDKLPPVELFSK